MLTPTQFARAQHLSNMISYGDFLTYSDLGPADRQLIEAYRLEENAFWDQKAEEAIASSIQLSEAELEDFPF